jgi:hypothetical protein
VSKDTTMVAESALSVDVRTLAARAVQLARGAVEAIPREMTTRTFGGELLLGSVGTGTLTSYFRKAQDAVDLIAVSGPDGILAESPEPLYLKIPLVVGESWDSHAADIPDLSQDGVTMDMQAKSRTFVVGKEKVGAGEAVRLEQVTELSGSARSEEGMSMGLSLSGQLQTAMHFAEGAGQVRQKMIGRITLSGSVAQGGDRLSMKMTLDFDGEMGAEPVLAKRGCTGNEGAAEPAEPSVAPAPARAREGGVDAAARALAGAALQGILSVAP